MQTITQKREEWLSKPGAVLCECKRGAKIQYRCYQRGCKGFKNYCLDCQEENKHRHAHVKCFDVINTSDRRWSIISERYENSVKAAKASYQKFAPLVKYFEAESINVPLNQAARQPSRCITEDYQILLSMNEKIIKIME